MQRGDRYRMRVDDLWRNRYDALLKENEQLKDKNKRLTNQLICTIGVVLITLISEIIDFTKG